MLYNFQNNIFALSCDASTEFKADLTSIEHICCISYREIDGTLFVSGIASNEATKKSGGKHPYKIYEVAKGSVLPTLFSPQYCFDPLPIGNSGNLVVSVGGGIAILDSQGKMVHKDRFGIEKAVNSELCVSPLGRFASISRWKGDEKKLMILDTQSFEFKYYPPSYYRYTWYNEDELLISTFGGYKILDRASGKVRKILPHFFKKSLIPLIRELPSNGEDSAVKSMLIDDFYEDCSEINWIKIFNDKLYAHWVYAIKYKQQAVVRFHGIATMSMDFSNNKIEYFGQANEIIHDFQVDHDGMIGAYVETDQGFPERAYGYRILNQDSSSEKQGWKIYPSLRNPIFWGDHI